MTKYFDVFMECEYCQRDVTTRMGLFHHRTVVKIGCRICKEHERIVLPTIIGAKMAVYRYKFKIEIVKTF